MSIGKAGISRFFRKSVWHKPLGFPAPPPQRGPGGPRGQTIAPSLSRARVYRPRAGSAKKRAHQTLAAWRAANYAHGGGIGLENEPALRFLPR
jgi:hypothetical protein